MQDNFDILFISFKIPLRNGGTGHLREAYNSKTLGFKGMV